jgi:hypothetical protein
MSIRGMKRRTFIAALGGAAAWSASGARTAAGDAGDRVSSSFLAGYPSTLWGGRLNDVRRQRWLHSLQNHGLRRRVPRGLFL